MHPDTAKIGAALLGSGAARNAEEAFDFAYHACKLISACMRNNLTVADAKRFLEEANHGRRGMSWAGTIMREENLKIPIDGIGIMWAACSISDLCKEHGWATEKAERIIEEVADSIEWWKEDAEDLQ